MLFKKKQIDITVYSVPGCHLCDEAIALIDSFSSKYELDTNIVDILSSPELIKKYQHDVPVVFAGGEEIFRHRIGRDELAQIFKKIK